MMMLPKNKVDEAIYFLHKLKKGEQKTCYVKDVQLFSRLWELNKMFWEWTDVTTPPADYEDDVKNRQIRGGGEDQRKRKGCVAQNTPQNESYGHLLYLSSSPSLLTLSSFLPKIILSLLWSFWMDNRRKRMENKRRWGGWEKLRPKLEGFWGREACSVYVSSIEHPYKPRQKISEPFGSPNIDFISNITTTFSPKPLFLSYSISSSSSPLLFFFPSCFRSSEFLKIELGPHHFILPPLQKSILFWIWSQHFLSPGAPQVLFSTTWHTLLWSSRVLLIYTPESLRKLPYHDFFTCLLIKLQLQDDH